MQPVKRRVRVSQLWTSLPVTRMVAARDIKIKYKQSALGPLWLLIAPLGLLAAVTIAFYGVTKVDTGGVPYVLFALVGLRVWIYIQLTLTTRRRRSSPTPPSSGAAPAPDRSPQRDAAFQRAAARR